MAFAPRMKKELELLEDPPHGIAAWPRDESDMALLDAQIEGVEKPYDGGVFRLEINLSQKYPFEPPNVRFITPIYHPNIDDAGRICLDLLKMPPKGQWKPSLNLTTVLTSVQQLMAEPNCTDPLMHDITQQYLNNREDFMSTAAEWTCRHAKVGVEGRRPEAARAAGGAAADPVGQDQGQGGGSSAPKRPAPVSSTSAMFKKRKTSPQQ